VRWCAAAFVLLQAAYFPLTDRWPNLTDPEYGLKLANLRRQVAAKRPGQPGVVMLGSSLTGWGLNPASMSTPRPGGPVVYNFGINSSGVVVQLVVLRRLLAEGVRPDLVLVEAHPWFLFPSYNHVASEHYLLPSHVRFGDLGVLRRYDPKWHRLLTEWKRLQWLPWYSHRHDLQNYLLPDWVSRESRTSVWSYTDRHGWEGMLSTVSGSGALGPAMQVVSAQHHLKAMSRQEIDPLFPRAYRELVETCRREQIPVMLVRMPETRYMREKAPPAFRERIDGCFETLSRETGAPIVDGRTWVGDADFVDAFHLLPSGSVSFSRRLERECLEPFLTRRQQLAARR
jgi:hypothetical protein